MADPDDVVYGVLVKALHVSVQVAYNAEGVKKNLSEKVDLADVNIMAGTILRFVWQDPENEDGELIYLSGGRFVGGREGLMVGDEVHGADQVGRRIIRCGGNVEILVGPGRVKE